MRWGTKINDTFRFHNSINTQFLGQIMCKHNIQSFSFIFSHLTFSSLPKIYLESSHQQSNLSCAKFGWYPSLYDTWFFLLMSTKCCTSASKNRRPWEVWDTLSLAPVADLYYKINYGNMFETIKKSV